MTLNLLVGIYSKKILFVINVYLVESIVLDLINDFPVRLLFGGFCFSIDCTALSNDF